jgi:uncharacterized protein (DUF305 family)
MRSFAASLVLAGLWAAPVLAQGDPHRHHQHHNQHQHHQAAPAAAPHSQDHGSHASHSHDVGPAGATYDLRWLDAMTAHHSGALRMSEFVLNIGSPGVGALANGIWREQAREIKAMGQWRKAWYPEAPVYPVAYLPGGDPNSIEALTRMSPDQIAGMRMMQSLPSKSNRVTWFLESMLQHHGGALTMARDALAKSTNPTILRLARNIILAQRQEIIRIRQLLQHDGLNKPQYFNYDALV